MENNKKKYINRELSWIAFNKRVLEQASNRSNPLFERIKFLSIFSTNLDEFFMVRIASLTKLFKDGQRECLSPDHMPIEDLLTEATAKITDLVNLQYKIFRSEIVPQLEEYGISFANVSDCHEAELATIEHLFNNKIFPVLTPLAVDPSHPFPVLMNSELYMLVLFEKFSGSKTLDEIDFGFVEIPENLPRLINVSTVPGKYKFLWIEDVIFNHLGPLFWGEKAKRYSLLRVTRNLDSEVLEGEVEDLLSYMKTEVVKREMQDAIRLEINGSIPKDIIKKIIRKTKLSPNQIYEIDGPIKLNDLMQICKIKGFDSLRFPPFNPRIPRTLGSNTDFFKVLRREDILVHHPFDSFYAVTDFLRLAAEDDKVLAIKLTLYRTSGDSPIIESLIQAAENGIKVTAVVELKARFDEKNNIVWARRLQKAGVNVVFGFVRLKTHSKVTLVVREENNEIMRYCHLSTGNYNSQTAKLYTDIGFFTSDKDYGADASAFFNVLTGFNIFAIRDKSYLNENIPTFKKLCLGPINLRQKLIQCMDEEIEFHKTHGNGCIKFKVNSLVDGKIVDKLYEASCAGVQIELFIRGICSLVPGVKDQSENIRVFSVIDRFLEHSRIYYFNANGRERIYLSSADLMVRNLNYRIETLFPIEQPSLKRRILDEIFTVYEKYTSSTSELQPDGQYVPMKKSVNGASASDLSAQSRFIEIAREGGLKSIPYDQAIHFRKRKGKKPILKGKTARNESK